MKADVKLDCFCLLCPMPIIQAAQKIKDMKIEEVLEVISTAGTKEDMPAWCRQTRQEYLGLKEEGETIKVYVRKVKDYPNTNAIILLSSRGAKRRGDLVNSS